MNAVFLLILFILLMAFGVPVAIAMGASTVTYLLLHMDIPLTVVAQQMVSGVDKFTLLAIPFFMMAGEFMGQGGISRKIITFTKALLGSMHGGLALVMILASMIFAAMTGAGAATCAAVGGMMIPFMKEEGYGEDFTCALQSTAGIFGPLIPPSILMVLFSVSTDASVSDMLLAGLVPGIVMGVVVAITSTVICIKNNYRGAGKFSFKSACTSFADAVLALLTPIIILGGIYSGLFTATEAAAVAALYSLVIGAFVYKELNFAKIKSILVTSMKTTAGLMLIVATTQLLGWVLTRERVPQMLAEQFMSLTTNPHVFLLLTAALLLVCGCFLDPVPAVMILAPILAPVSAGYGINPIHFGTIMVVGLVIGLITPPVGVNLFVVSSIAQRPVHKFIPNIIPFLITVIIGYLIVIFVPALSTYLPMLSHR